MGCGCIVTMFWACTQQRGTVTSMPSTGLWVKIYMPLTFGGPRAMHIKEKCLGVDKVCGDRHAKE